MKRIHLLALTLLLLVAGASQAQKLNPAEFNGGGGSGKNTAANMSLDYSLGNAYGTSTVALSISLVPANARVATEQDVEGLPEILQEQILTTKAGIKAWPVPSEGPVQLLLEGVEKGTEAQVYDRTGRLIQSIELHPNEPQELKLPESGIFFIRTSNREIPTVRLERY